MVQAWNCCYSTEMTMRGRHVSFLLIHSSIAPITIGMFLFLACRLGKSMGIEFTDRSIHLLECALMIPKFYSIRMAEWLLFRGITLAMKHRETAIILQLR